MYVDYKVTTWNRVHFSDDTDSKKIIKTIQEEGIDSIFDYDLGFIEQETLFEVDEKMTLEENNGFPTIEVYKINECIDKLIWSNEKR